MGCKPALASPVGADRFLSDNLAAFGRTAQLQRFERLGFAEQEVRVELEDVLEELHH